MIASALKNVVLFVLALVLSVLVWAIAQLEQNPEVEITVQDVPIQVRHVGAGLEVSAIGQTTASISARAPQDIASGLDARDFEAWVDLAALDAGAHDVSVSVTSAEKWTRISRTTPNYVSITLERMRQKVVPVVVSVLDDAPAGYSLGSAVVTPTQVLISGRQSIVDQVTEAVALLRVEGARTDIQRLARPLLRDGRGSEVIGKLTMAPETVSISVPVIQLQSYKTVALRAVITGTVAGGYRITSIVVEPQTLVLGGDPRTLEGINYIDTTTVDVSGARADVTKSARFTLPAGVATDRRSDIFVNVRVEPIPGQEIVRRPVTWQNLDRTLRVVAPLSPTVDIELAGPLADLAALNVNDIMVTVNLSGMSPGVIERTPVIAGLPATLSVVSVKPERLIILIEAIPTPTPTPTVTPTGAPRTPSPGVSPATSSVVTPTVTPTATPTMTPAPRPGAQWRRAGSGHG